MAQYASGIAFALGNAGSGEFVAMSNGILQLNWAGTSTDLSLVLGGSTIIMATGSAAPNSVGEVKIPVRAGQLVTVTTGAAMKVLVSSQQRLA